MTGSTQHQWIQTERRDVCTLRSMQSRLWLMSDGLKSQKKVKHCTTKCAENLVYQFPLRQILFLLLHTVWKCAFKRTKVFPLLQLLSVFVRITQTLNHVNKHLRLTPLIHDKMYHHLRHDLYALRSLSQKCLGGRILHKTYTDKVKYTECWGWKQACHGKTSALSQRSKTLVIMLLIFSPSRSFGFGEQCSEVWQPVLCSTSSGKHIILLFPAH